MLLRIPLEPGAGPADASTEGTDSGTAGTAGESGFDIADAASELADSRDDVRAPDADSCAEDAVPWSQPTRVDDPEEATSNDRPQMALDGSGDAVAVWESNGASRGGWYAKSAGTWGHPQVIDGVERSDRPVLGLLAGGDALAVWSRHAAGLEGVWASRGGKKAAWQPLRRWARARCSAPRSRPGDREPPSRSGSIPPPTATTSSTRARCPSPIPEVAMDDVGNVIVAWTERDQSDRLQARARRRSRSTGWEVGDGGAQPPPFETDNEANTTVDWVNTSLAMNRAGSAIVAWAKRHNGVFDARAKRYSPRTGWGLVSLLEPRNDESIFAPRAAISADGTAGVVFCYQKEATVWTSFAAPLP